MTTNPKIKVTIEVEVEITDETAVRSHSTSESMRLTRLEAGLELPEGTPEPTIEQQAGDVVTTLLQLRSGREQLARRGLKVGRGEIRVDYPDGYTVQVLDASESDGIPDEYVVPPQE